MGPTDFQSTAGQSLADRLLALCATFLAWFGPLSCLLVAPLPAACLQRSASEIPQIASEIQSAHYDQALALIHQALQASPQSARLWTLQAIAYERSGRQDQALAAYRHALQLHAKYLPALEGAAEIEYRNADPHALVSLREILAVRPQDTTARGMLAAMEYKDKDCAAAVQDFALSGADASDRPSILGEYGYCLATLHRSKQALPVLEKALALQPDAVHVRYDLALDEWMADRPADALATLHPLLLADSGQDAALKLAADIYESQGDTENAVPLLRRAILQDPKDVDNYVDFATLSNNHKSYRVGIDMLDAGLKELPDAAQLYLARGILYSQLSEYEHAMADFEQADRLDPTVASAAEGLLQSQQHHLDAAIQKFRAAAHQRPNDAYAQYLLADALSQKSMAPGSTAYNEAVHAANRAVQLDPNLTAAHDLLATLYLRAGDIERAMTNCQDALRRVPDDQQALYHLILALRKTGRREEIPELAARLAKIRQNALTEQKRKTFYRLSDQP
jgi:tetratricopeptide (TPR) repeat protein